MVIDDCVSENNSFWSILNWQSRKIMVVETADKYYSWKWRNNEFFVTNLRRIYIFVRIIIFYNIYETV